ncbi:hypothetical protein GH714_004006 [Hevea brasiliensis]|uniref:LisH domain-containing protein n=1 Tax=Hevea brasiliensis TaxID=3981 RepID=A0A6A6KIZ1_HEVBR|nr:hypothetical protein GH714_004006 [Hevea brasiliensis]
MSSLSRELVFLILQFLDEEKFKETVHKLEQESGFFFNMKHFEDQVQAGEWDEVERYLCGFTKDRAKAVEILVKDLKVFASFNEELFKEITQLLTLDNFSLNWQHQLCKNPRPNPDIKTLFTDHSCTPTTANGARPPPPTNSPIVGPIPKAGAFPPIGAHGPFHSIVSPSPGAIAGWMSSNNPPLPHPAVAAGPPGLVQPSSAAAFLKHPRTPTGMTGIDYQSADSEHLMKLGTNVGDISLWEVGSRERLVHKPFKVWDLSVASMPLQTALLNDAAISVNRCVWGPDGLMLGVAFSKHIVQIYTYNPTGELRQHLEIDAHVGGVNDIAFAHPNKQLCIVTCGDDKMIKVWDAVAGRRQYTFEGHEAPVYSVCPHYKENIQFIFSTAIDGKIKAWLYDSLGSRVDYDAPGLWCTMMAYSADGTRKRSSGVVQFDTTRSRFLAAGDEFLIKFWEMDNTNMLIAVDADGGLPASPRLRFNKEGSLLAVTTSDNGIKILANSDGLRLIRMLESRAIDKNCSSSEPINSKPLIVNAFGPVANVSSGIPPVLERSDRIPPAVSISSVGTMDSNRLVDVKPRISDELDKIKSWKIPDIVDPSQLKALRLPDPIATGKVVRLIYTNSGLALLALASNAVHKLWKWQRSERNQSGKATAYVAPQLWQPPSGTLMTNDISDNKPAEESAACIALSKNDSYVMSASGGKVSLFNMMTFKVMTTFMSPPPAATFLAFHPQDNNIIAIGMEDSSVQIYNVRVDEVKTKLKGHQSRISGLAFSQCLNVLVSSGADAQLCVWSIDGWEKRKSRFIQAPPGRQSPLTGETRVQFHNDQTHLLVVHESQIAIYDSKLECLRSWYPKDTLAAPFQVRYIRVMVCCNNAYPLVIAAHPSEPNQIALGMSDGAVHVVEPTDVELKWGGPSSQDNGPLPSNSSNPSLSGQQSELPSR